MSNIRNPYNNTHLETQPFGSVNDSVKGNENIYIEEAGLNQYNFQDVGNELRVWQELQKDHRAAFPPNRTKEFNIDTSNKYLPHLQPIFYKGVAQNIALLNNPPDHNQNLDLASQRTYIKPYISTKEMFGRVLPIEVQDTKLALGPVYITNSKPLH